MPDLWLVTIEVWPHSTGKGQVADQASAGDRVQNFAVRAVDIAAALELAECIAQGMRTNPMVWRAPIKAIVQESEWMKLGGKTVDSVDPAPSACTTASPVTQR